MRHRKDNRKLGRTASHRKALFANLAISLFAHKQIRTTTAKAKEARRHIEKLITFAKRGTLADRRQVLRAIGDKSAVKNLFDEIAPSYKDRSGGYTRVIRLGRRQGDGAEMAILELVGFEGVQLEKQRQRDEAKEKKKKKEAEKAETTEQSSTADEE